ncbi:MAG: glycosyltransferase [Salibacteraceae bacterium]
MSETVDLPPVSVVIAVRNEALIIKNLLCDLSLQSSASFEVILIDDHSDDDTFSIIQQWSLKNPRFIAHRLNNGEGSGKKHALAKGIEMAQFEHLIFTDADCRIYDSNWIERFQHAFQKGGEFLIGTGAFTEESGFISRFYQLEAFKSAMLYQCAAALGFPYMCVGRSMGLTKTKFNEVGGFEKHTELQSGSDDLLLQALVGKAKIVALPHAVTWSDTPSSLRDWVFQKHRHQSVSHLYPLWARLGLVGYECTNLMLFPILLVALFLSSKLLTGFVLVRYLMFYVNLSGLKKWADINRAIDKDWYLEIPMSYLNALISVLSLAIKKIEWTKRSQIQEQNTITS